MNLRDMTKLLGMATSGEMQNFVANFQAELDALKHDRLGLKQAFPKGFAHFNQRLDNLESKIDTILVLLTPPQGKDFGVIITERKGTEHHVINGTTDGTGTRAPARGDHASE